MILLTVFLTIFIAEMGDKTQLLLVAMANKYKVSQILIGTWTATVVLNLLAVVLGSALSQYIDLRIIKTIAGFAFLYFAMSSVSGDDDDEEEENIGKASKFGPTLAIFGAFFLGELGDKTQLSAITMAANYTNHKLMNAVFVFLGCTLGLILADLLGLIVGLALKSKMPTKILNWVSFGIFTFFGILTLYQAFSMIFKSNKAVAVSVSALAAVLFGLFTLFKLKALHEKTNR